MEGQPPSQTPRVFRYDSVQRLSATAPLWCIIQSFDCRDSLPTMQVVEASRLVELYASKALSRSTCLAGLSNACRAMLGSINHISAAFFRPLEYILELCEAGPNFYRAIAPEDLQLGLPPPNWCLPLHTQLHLQATNAELPPALGTDAGTLQGLAINALSNAQWWCIVHKYHEDTARCDFNWQPRDLVAGLLSKAVSPYTLVIGIDTHKDRSLPWMRPSLFVPLAALLHQHQSGIAYPAVSRNDLVVFNQLGFKGALATVLQEGVVPILPELPAPGSSGNPGTSMAAMPMGVDKGGAAANLLAGQVLLQTQGGLSTLQGVMLGAGNSGVWPGNAGGLGHTSAGATVFDAGDVQLDAQGGVLGGVLGGRFAGAGHSSAPPAPAALMRGQSVGLQQQAQMQQAAQQQQHTQQQQQLNVLQRQLSQQQQQLLAVQQQQQQLLAGTQQPSGLMGSQIGSFVLGNAPSQSGGTGVSGGSERSNQSGPAANDHLSLFSSLNLQPRSGPGSGANLEGVPGLAPQQAAQALQTQQQQQRSGLGPVQPMTQQSGAVHGQMPPLGQLSSVTSGQQSPPGMVSSAVGAMGAPCHSTMAGSSGLLPRFHTSPLVIGQGLAGFPLLPSPMPLGQISQHADNWQSPLFRLFTTSFKPGSSNQQGGGSAAAGGAGATGAALAAGGPSSGSNVMSGGPGSTPSVRDGTAGNRGTTAGALPSSPRLGDAPGVSAAAGVGGGAATTSDTATTVPGSVSPPPIGPFSTTVGGAAGSTRHASTTGAASPGPGQEPQPAPGWWVLDSPGNRVTGPFSCEQMIVAYLQSVINDTTLVCGTNLASSKPSTADEAAAQQQVTVSRVMAVAGTVQQPPPRFFEQVGALLQAVQQGGSYALVCQDEIRSAIAASGERSGSSSTLSMLPAGVQIGGSGIWRTTSNAGRESTDPALSALMPLHEHASYSAPIISPSTTLGSLDAQLQALVQTSSHFTS